MAWNNHRAAFLFIRRYGDVQDEVQSIHHTINAAAVLHVDNGIRRGAEDVTRADDVGPPEKDDAVAIRVGWFWVE